MGKEMSNGLWCTCWAVILFAWFMSFAQGCADSKCPDGTSVKALGVCSVLGGAGSKSVAGGTGSMKFELGEAGSGIDVGGGDVDEGSDRNLVDVEASGSGGGGGVGDSGMDDRAVRPTGAGGMSVGAGSAGSKHDEPSPVVGGGGGDGAGGASASTPTCGNGKRDPGELCDGDCPVDCDDNNACTVDVMHGSAATCDVFCGYTNVEEGSVCGDSAYCLNTGECLHNCKPGQPKCAGQPGTGSCVEASSFVSCDGNVSICVAQYIPEGSTCGPGLTCTADHNCNAK